MNLYTRKLRPEEALVEACRFGSVESRPFLDAGFNEASTRFGFTFRAVESNILTASLLDKPLWAQSLAILVDAPLAYAYETPALAGLLAKYDSVSLAIKYPDSASARRASSIIDQQKARYGDRLNFLRPDRTDDEGVYVSDQKIIDNAVCDTIRVKFAPDQRSSQVPILTSDETLFFDRCSKVYESLSMFHRSRTDGYFALRRTSSSFLITATKTCKYPFDHNRVVNVLGFDPQSGVLQFEGEYLPSSDSIEAAVVFNELPEVNALFHTHASAQVTRNSEYAHKILVPQLPYGEFPTGLALAEAFRASKSPFVIMEEHGEVFAFQMIDQVETVPDLLANERKV
jgi:hypothetical protein